MIQIAKIENYTNKLQMPDIQITNCSIYNASYHDILWCDWKPQMTDLADYPNTKFK
jgi:hypothetical protein